MIKNISESVIPIINALNSLTFILGNKHLDVQRNVLVKIQFANVKRFDNGTLIQQQ